jgi:DNA-directed RNA polymerase I, II, and III subunit RPABC1
MEVDAAIRRQKREEFDNSMASLLLKVKKHQLEMVRDRGYDITLEEPLLEWGILQFVEYFTEKAQIERTSFRESLCSVYSKPDGTKIHVRFLNTPTKTKTKDDEGKIKTEQVKEIIEYIRRESVRNLVLITEEDITSPAQKKLEELRSVNIQHFLYRQLGYNPTKHYLVPQHILMTDEEAKQFLTSNNLRLEDLPLISHIDPIARYYGMRNGQIVKIIRRNFIVETMVDEYVSYRCVSNTPLEREEPKEQLS